MPPTITLIAAVASNGVIGADGDIPWYLPADLQHFRATTTGHPVIMGRTTYESLPANHDAPAGLPDRTNIVLTSQPDAVDAPTAADLGVDPTALPTLEATCTTDDLPAAAQPTADRVADTACSLTPTASDTATATDVVAVPSCRHAMAVAHAVDAASDRVFITGGATVYEQFLPYADELMLSELDAAYDGDTRFPDFDPSAWTVTDRDPYDAFTVVTYRRAD